MQRFFLIVFLLFIANISYAQNQDSVKEINISGSFNDTSAEDFFTFLEENYGINVYYQEDWIDSLIVGSTFDEIPLIQVLNRLFGQGKITYEFFQGSIVLFPRSSSVRSYDEASVLYIGDPINEGRYSKAIVSGTVIDGKIGERLTGAIVYVRDMEKGFTTNARGEFEIELPTGKHQLQINFVGFEPVTRDIEVFEDGEVVFELFEETHNLDEVTVTADNSNSTRTQMSMMKVNSKVIKELPVLMGEADVIKSVIMMPGVQSVGELSSGFNVRGGNSDQNLVLMDGAPIFNTSHLFGFFSMINPDAVSNVTLYKGGLPASYGDRVSSVMDIQLKEGEIEQLQFNGGVGLVNSRFTLEGPFVEEKKSSFLIGGRSTYSDWILRQTKNVEFKNSVANFYDINANVKLNFSDKHNLKLMAYNSGDEFNLNSSSLYKYDNLIAALNWKLGLSNKVVSNLNAAYSVYDFELDEKDEFISDNDYILLTGIEYGSIKYNLSYLPTEELSFNTGFQVTAQQVNPGEIKPAHDITAIDYTKINDEKALEYALYLESELDLSDNLSMSIGARYSRFSNLGKATVYLYDKNYTRSVDNVIDSLVFGNNDVVKTYQGLEPRISFKYNLNSGGSIRWAYQRIYQYANQISNTSVVSPADFWKLSDYYVKPLLSDQVAAGFFKDYTQSGLETSFEVYYKKLKNLLEYKNGSKLVMNKSIETDIIQADGYSYGMELYIKKSVGRLNGWLSYTYSRTMRKTDNKFDSEIINRGKYYPSVYDRPHDMSIVANYQISRRWRLSGNFVLSSGRPTTLPEQKFNYGGQQVVYYSDRNEYRMPTYHRLDVSLTIDENLKRKRSWKGSWTLSIYNVYGRKNPYSIYYQKNQVDVAENGLYGLYKFSIIGIPVPSITYNFKF